MLVGTPDSSRLPSVSVRVFLVLSKLYTCLPCSLQVVSFIRSPLLFFSQAALGRMLLPTCLPSYKSPCLSLCALGRNLLSVTFPYPLSTTCFPPSGLLILSPLPCFFLGLQHFGTEKRAFLLFPFFHYLFLLSFPVPSSLLSSLLLFFLGAFETQDFHCLQFVSLFCYIV